jgi:hypothetical protein
MCAARSKLCREAVSIAGEGEQRMKAALPKMTVERYILLIAVRRVFR